MRLDADHVFGLLQCPLRHAIRSTTRLTPTQQLTLTYENAIRDTVLFYHEERLNGETPSIDDLSKYFGEKWYGRISKEDVLTSRTVRKKIGPANEAMIWLSYYVQAERRRPSKTLEVRRPFTVKIGEHLIDGQIDLVQEVETDDGPKIELASFTLAKSRPSDFYIRTKLDLTLQAYAFRKLYDTQEDLISLWWLKSGERFETHRTPKDFKKLLIQVEQAVWWANAEPTPRYGAHCNICQFQEECLEWEGGLKPE